MSIITKKALFEFELIGKAKTLLKKGISTKLACD